MLQLIPTIVQSTAFDAFSGKEFLDADGLMPGFYVVATGPIGWRGAQIYYSADGGTTWTNGGHVGGSASFGICNSALTNGAAALSIDTTDTLDVQLYNNGQLVSCSLNDLANGVNGALVGTELISFLNVAAGSSNLEFLLTTLTRGQRSTSTSGHVIGERFWLIDSNVARVSVSPTLIATSVLVAAIGYGQNITDADVSPVSVTIALNNYPYGSASTFSAENKDGTTISAGMACAMHSSGVGIIHADNTDNSKNAVGLAISDIPASASGLVQTSGTMVLSDWTIPTGASSFPALSPQFLGAAGAMTTVPTTTVGNGLQIVGRPIGPQTLEILAEPGILL